VITQTRLEDGHKVEMTTAGHKYF